MLWPLVIHGLATIEIWLFDMTTDHRFYQLTSLITTRHITRTHDLHFVGTKRQPCEVSSVHTHYLYHVHEPLESHQNVLAQ